MMLICAAHFGLFMFVFFMAAAVQDETPFSVSWKFWVSVLFFCVFSTCSMITMAKLGVL